MTITVSEINKFAKDPKKFIKSSEDYYHSEISAISDYVKNNRNIKLVLLSGPSGSGKTTSAHMLSVYLRKRNIPSHTVSLDDFYLPYDRLPVLENGKFDTETVNSLDIDEISRCFNEILNTGETMLPHFDFMTKQKHERVRHLKLEKDGIVIVEGLHALNPLITDFLPENTVYKIYISVNSPVLNDDGSVLLSSRKIRFIRRTLRDEIFRNTKLEKTLLMWEEVVRAEDDFLTALKSTADMNLITLHFYELCVYKSRYLRAFSELSKKADGYDYALKVAKALTEFDEIDLSSVPKSSLIREFLGDGEY